MITQELKAAWQAALRSGKYIQGEGALVSDGWDSPEHCCLGVLAELCGIPRAELEEKSDLSDVKRDDLLGAWSSGEQAEPTFASNDPDTHTTLQKKLAGLNDNGSSFDEIAEWIEENVPVTSAQQGASHG